MADKTQDKISRREVLAFIALQDLPMPDGVLFVDSMMSPAPVEVLRIRFAGLGSDQMLAIWARVFGVTDDARHYDYPKDREPNRVYNVDGAWRGWRFDMMATVPLPQVAGVESLDEDTTARLREIAGGDQ